MKRKCIECSCIMTLEYFGKHTKRKSSNKKCNVCLSVFDKSIFNNDIKNIIYLYNIVLKKNIKKIKENISILKKFNLIKECKILNNKNKYKELSKEYYIINKKDINKKISIKYKNDELFRLKHNIRNLIRNSINSSGNRKDMKSEAILGCSFQEFRDYLESKFEDWMNWSNRGLYNGSFNHGWDMDHIIPVSSAKTKDDIIKLNHYTNFQPLCSKINRDVKINKLND